mmetsp:Transcript_12187/g.34285  ORF Transcript_12187/g.34285 Transcript_12187/m.34285 type:complete len:320 (+) Transcript_12187:93-1052(+)
MLNWVISLSHHCRGCCRQALGGRLWVHRRDLKCRIRDGRTAHTSAPSYESGSEHGRGPSIPKYARRSTSLLTACFSASASATLCISCCMRRVASPSGYRLVFSASSFRPFAMAAFVTQQSSGAGADIHDPCFSPLDLYLHICLWCGQSTLAQVSEQYHTEPQCSQGCSFFPPAPKYPFFPQPEHCATPSVFGTPLPPADACLAVAASRRPLPRILVEPLPRPAAPRYMSVRPSHFSRMSIPLPSLLAVTNESFLTLYRSSSLLANRRFSCWISRCSISRLISLDSSGGAGHSTCGLDISRPGIAALRCFPWGRAPRKDL